MPSFKPKSNKKIRICKKYTTTLDGKHKEFINEFSKNDFDTIPKLKEGRSLLKKQIENFENNNKNKDKDNIEPNEKNETNVDNLINIEKIMDVKDRIKEINLTIKDLTKPITIEFEYSGTAVDPYGNARYGFEGSSEINRKDFGLVWNAALETGGVIVSDAIKLEFEISTILAK